MTDAPKIKISLPEDGSEASGSGDGYTWRISARRVLISAEVWAAMTPELRALYEREVRHFNFGA